MNSGGEFISLFMDLLRTGKGTVSLYFTTNKTVTENVFQVFLTPMYNINRPLRDLRDMLHDDLNRT